MVTKAGISRKMKILIRMEPTFSRNTLQKF